MAITERDRDELVALYRSEHPMGGKAPERDRSGDALFSNPPPRKDCLAWSFDAMEENGDSFIVLTLHHGLGRMTRVDLWPQDVRDMAASALRCVEEEFGA